MKLFFAYLRQRRRAFGIFAAFALIYMLLFALYRLPLAAVLYPTGLSALLGLGLLALDFRQMLRRHKMLAAIRDLTDAALIALPEPRGIEEEDYQRILTLLCREQAQRESRMRDAYQDMMEYYTVWAHQVKIPIAAMRLNLQNEDSSLARKLMADLRRTEQYVEMVLVFLRLDADSTDYVFRQQSLDKILRQAVKKFAGEFIARKLKLVYEPVEVSVVTDEKWLSFVIEQVLSNALKYTPSGQIRIYMEKPQTLCIADTGIGIERSDLPRIFEKGYTGCNGRLDKRSSGIGLYLCRRICGRLGHCISAQSEPGEGTVIRIDLAQNALRPE